MDPTRPHDNEKTNPKKNTDTETHTVRGGGGGGGTEKT